MSQKFRFVLTAALFWPTPALTQTCPSDDPKKIQSMMAELRDTFECNGLNFKSCIEYRGIVIGGAAAGVVVGGRVAAKTLAGLAFMKSKSIVCPLPGTSAGLKITSSSREFLAALAMGEDVHAAIPGSNCTMAKSAAVKEFDALRRSAFESGKSIRSQMLDVMLTHGVTAPDASKIAVTDAEIKKAYASGLDKLEADVKSSALSTGKKEQVFDRLKYAREYLRTNTEVAELAMSHLSERVWDELPYDFKDGLSKETKSGIAWYELRAQLRTKKIAANPATARAETLVLSELETFFSKSSSAQAEYLASKGYKPEMIKDLMGMGQAAQALSRTGSGYQMASYQLTSGKFRSLSEVSLEQIKDVTRTNGVFSHVRDIRIFHSFPGLNNGLPATIRRVGAEAIAKIATSDAAQIGLKYVAPVVGGIGKAMALPVQVAYEAATFSNDPHCGGEISSSYANLKMIENERGNQACHSVEARTEKTDEFLYGLSPADQLTEVRNNRGTCDLLARMYSRYAPSQNWDVTCQGTTAQMTGKNSKGEGQMIRFDAASGMPQKIEWYSGSFKQCAKVSMKDDAFESAQVYETSPGMNGCGSVGKATTVRDADLYLRQNTSDEKKMVKEFANWQDSNSLAMAAATDCCRTGSSAENPMCPVSRGGRSAPGSGATTRGITR